ncbi:MAG: hypothetical protein K8T25_22345 [Planctomycetia bacterium]|nr:hypothetical protein [Planctomycetia bacterium]
MADIPELLPGAALLAIGGTDDDIEPLRKRFTPGVVSAIQDYVRSGGRFAGFCGGGYLASQGYDNDEGFVHCLGIVPATSDSYLEDSAARTLSIQWRGTRRNMFYQFGPKFIPKKSSEAVEVVGKYDDGSIAALLCTYGKGKALVSGPHPEANDSWRDEIKGGESDWTPEPEVATAAIRDLLSDRAVGK